MKRLLSLSTEASLRIFDGGEYQVFLLVNRDVVVQLIIELTLLLESLVSDLTLVSEPALSVRFSMEANGSVSTGRVVESVAEVCLLTRDLDLLRSFLLKYYRDGEAEVGHIDIDLYDGTTHAENGMLTVRAADCKPGLTAEEAQRMLGIL